MAKSLILYQSSHGNTEKILKDIIRDLHGDVDLKPIKGFKASDLGIYERIAFGGSIHMGKIQKPVVSFMKRHGEKLKQKPLALFIGCLDKTDEQLKKVFPEDLRSCAEVTACIGGDVVMEKLPAIMRGMMTKITPNEEDRHYTAEKGREALKNFLER